MNFFWNRKYARAAAVKAAPKLAAPPLSAPWMVDDVLNLAKFLETPTGIKLRQRARAMEYSTAVSSCRDAFHTAHSAGIATGVSDTINWLESLASDEMRQKLSVPTPDDVGNPHNTADSEHDDAGLVEKYSP